MNEQQIKKFWDKVNIKSENDCWEWIASYRLNGYGAFKTKEKTHGSHRLAYELTYGIITDNTLNVCHKCDNRKCVNPNHLFLGTQSENMKDCLNKGRLVIPEGQRFKKGNIPKNRIMSEEIANEIYNEIINRRKLKEKLNLKQLSIKYNISYESIRDISCGRTYKTQPSV
jgi:hypothetical protein